MENETKSIAENDASANAGGNAATGAKPTDDSGGTLPGGLSFEDAYRQLQDLVKKMEAGALPLADSVKAYEQAAKLKAYCEQLLKQAETKIAQLDPNQ